MDFLVDLFEKELSWSAINTARSSLSMFLKVDDIPVGRHPDVIRLMKGLYNMNPPKARYTAVWDARKVLNKLRQWSPVKSLPLKLLTLKFVMLFSLVTAQRGQALHLLDLSACKRTKSAYILTFSQVLKQSRPGKTVPVLELNMHQTGVWI